MKKQIQLLAWQIADSTQTQTERGKTDCGVNLLDLTTA